MAIDTDTLIYKLLKDELSTINTSRSDAIAITWHDRAEEFDSPAGTYGSFGIMRTSAPTRVDLAAEPRLVKEAVVDNITFNAGTLDYALTEQDVAEIDSITGTFGGGGGHTFAQGVDYELVSINGSLYDNAVRWLGADLPDDTTTFTVNYKEFKVTQDAVVTDKVTYRLLIHCIEETVGGNFYPKSTVAREAKQSFYRDLAFLRGKSLGDGVVVLGFREFGIPSMSDGENRLRVMIDLDLGVTDRYEKSRVERVGRYSSTYQFTK